MGELFGMGIVSPWSYYRKIIYLKPHPKMSTINNILLYFALFYINLNFYIA